MSRRKLTVVLACAFGFMGLTLFEVVTLREDWPLSPYPLYARLPPEVATRTVFVGVSERGEFPLTRQHTEPYNGARLLFTSRRLLKSQVATFACLLPWGALLPRLDALDARLRPRLEARLRAVH